MPTIEAYTIRFDDFFLCTAQIIMKFNAEIIHLHLCQRENTYVFPNACICL